MALRPLKTNTPTDVVSRMLCVVCCVPTQETPPSVAFLKKAGSESPLGKVSTLVAVALVVVGGGSAVRCAVRWCGAAHIAVVGSVNCGRKYSIVEVVPSVGFLNMRVARMGNWAINF